MTTLQLRHAAENGNAWVHFMTSKERAEKRIDGIYRRRRKALEGWLELATHKRLSACDIQLMEWEEENFSRELLAAYGVRGGCS